MVKAQMRVVANSALCESQVKKLLEQSLERWFLTSSIVWKTYLVMRWKFCRQLLGESKIRKRLKNWLPVACINPKKKGQALHDMRSLLWHNRAVKAPDNLSNEYCRDMSAPGLDR